MISENNEARTADMFGLPAAGIEPGGFSPKDIARRTDPGTSKQAAKRFTGTNRASHCDIVRDLVREYPWKTVGEYRMIFVRRAVAAAKADKFVTLDELIKVVLQAARVVSTKRLSDLDNAGELLIGKARSCEETGHAARTHALKADCL